MSTKPDLSLSLFSLSPEYLYCLLQISDDTQQPIAVLLHEAFDLLFAKYTEDEWLYGDNADTPARITAVRKVRRNE